MAYLFGTPNCCDGIIWDQQGVHSFTISLGWVAITTHPVFNTLFRPKVLSS